MSEGRRALVTGGTRGLGLAIARELGGPGARVAITYATDDASASEARGLLEGTGAEVQVFKGSVADSAHVTATVQALDRSWGGIDVLVNAAGQTQVLPIALLEEEDWDRVMEVNVKGAWLFSRAVLRKMIKARRGHILMIGTFASERLVESPIHFAAAKSALRGLTEALAREVGRYDIQVNLLGPGLLDGGMGQFLPRARVDEYLQRCPLGRLGSLEELARMAAFLVSDRNRFMSAAKIIADGGL